MAVITDSVYCPGCCSVTDPLIAQGWSAGGNLGCQMGPPIKTYYRNPPYILKKNRSYKLRIEVTSGDENYHQGAFYVVNYSFTPNLNLTWSLSQSGSSNPWSTDNDGRTISFTFEDSANCGGFNDNVQSGTAEAIIQPTENTSMILSFTGLAELEAVEFERIDFYLELLNT